MCKVDLIWRLSSQYDVFAYGMTDQCMSKRCLGAHYIHHSTSWKQCMSYNNFILRMFRYRERRGCVLVKSFGGTILRSMYSMLKKVSTNVRIWWASLSHVLSEFEITTPRKFFALNTTPLRVTRRGLRSNLASVRWIWPLMMQSFKRMSETKKYSLFQKLFYAVPDLSKVCLCHKGVLSPFCWSGVTYSNFAALSNFNSAQWVHLTSSQLE